MNLPLISLMVIALAVLFGTVRSMRFAGSRRWLLALGQLLMGGALALLLFPPSLPRDRETAVVLSPGVTASQMEGIQADATLIVLPEVLPEIVRTERAADLGSALRQHPEIGSLRILGDGLPARDRAVVAGLGLAFEPAPEPTGLVELQVPESVSAGTLWTLTGRVAGVTGARLELVDRSDAVVAAATVGDDGRFRLATTSKSSARMLYRLRVLDASDVEIEHVPVAVDVRSGDSLRTDRKSVV